ncbi:MULTISPECIES: DUF4212 domain-containing protein [unclassified Mesorhizobium]|uniref:DUF4212 domain-containing protein n=1 Tax=unclassified Mesorhizobium TaxID=325217 RepID=UPI00237AD729|nr:MULTISPECIES: DUF4212 domain-containing protein [unclassified Mesorhizobium]
MPLSARHSVSLDYRGDGFRRTTGDSHSGAAPSPTWYHWAGLASRRRPEGRSSSRRHDGTGHAEKGDRHGSVGPQRILATQPRLGAGRRGCIVLAPRLDRVVMPGFALAFHMTVQSLSLIFVVSLFWFADSQASIDEKHGVD